MDVFQSRRVNLELAVLDLQHRVEEDIALGVGIRNACEVSTKRQMAPAARLDILRVAWKGERGKHERTHAPCESIPPAGSAGFS